MNRMTLLVLGLLNQLYAKVRNTAERFVQMQHHEVTELADLKRRLIKIESILHHISVAPARVMVGGSRTTALGAPIIVGVPV